MSEEVNKRNILAIQQYSEQTRELFREMELIMNDLKNQNENLKSQVNIVKTQIQSMQVRVYSGRATG